MNSWMAQATDQFRQTSALLSQLDQKGFTPISTAPTHQAQLRRDHTMAIIERLASWSPEAFTYPLKVFSSGPVFEHGSWAESLDVEVLEDSMADAEAIIFDLLTHLVAERFSASQHQNLVFVAGHLGLLRTLLGDSHWPDDARETLERLLADGQFTAAEQCVLHRSPELWPLFRPAAPMAARAHLHSLSQASGAEDLHGYVKNLPTVVDHVPSVRWDLSLTGSFPYYSGLVFALYARGQGEALIKGGRFSLRYQGRHWQGAGFTIVLPEWFAS